MRFELKDLTLWRREIMKNYSKEQRKSLQEPGTREIQDSREINYIKGV